MVIVVVAINTLISLILLYAAWRLWKLKKRIARIADRLVVYECHSHLLLHQAPENIYASQQGIHNLRLKNQALQVQIQQVRQIINLLLFAQQIWRRYFRRLDSTFGEKTPAR
jgi:hypothetical protein